MDKMIPFKEIEHTADIGLQIFGRDLNELFSNALHGFYALVFGSLKNFQNISTLSMPIKEIKQIRINEASLEDLLVSFLSEINFNLQVHHRLFVPLHYLKIEPKGHRYLLLMESGQIILQENELNHLMEIKAVTYHGLEIVKQNEGYQVTVIFDI